MKRLRWPGFAIRSMVWTVDSGNTMLMRLLMEMRVNDLCVQYIHQECVCQVISRPWEVFQGLPSNGYNSSYGLDEGWLSQDSRAQAGQSANLFSR